MEEPEPEPAENDGNIMESLTEREQIVLDVFKAQWYGREDGYQGGECVCAACTGESNVVDWQTIKAHKTLLNPSQ